MNRNFQSRFSPSVDPLRCFFSLSQPGLPKESSVCMVRRKVEVCGEVCPSKLGLGDKGQLGGGGGGGGTFAKACLTETTVVPAMRSKYL